MPACRKERELCVSWSLIVSSHKPQCGGGRHRLGEAELFVQTQEAADIGTEPVFSAPNTPFFPLPSDEWA